MYRVALSLLIPVLVAGSYTSRAQTSARTVWDGVYTEAQAHRGKIAFEARCARCHGGDFRRLAAQGFPLEGEDFLDLWREDNLDVLFRYIRANMPKGGENPSDGSDRPASVSDNEKLDILAYLLKSNGMAPGSSELTLDAVATTLLVGKDGPKPLPNLTNVSVVGCLSAAGPDSWKLTNAGNPVRTADPTQATPEEISGFASKPPGTAMVSLRNLSDLAGFKPVDYEGHRVLVKGILYTSNRHVNVTSAASLAASCGP
jgi:S-disulfanyl-L-cysteine oxidoreductase SoxD